MSAIILAQALRAGTDAAKLALAAAEPLLNEAPGRWESVVETPGVSAGIIWRGRKPRAGADIARADDVSVLVDGFLSFDVPGGKDSGKRSHAALMADAYRGGGIEALQNLRGSFVVVLVDHASDRLVVLTDRSGSRPMYVGKTSDALLVAPELKAFHRIAGMHEEIVPGAVLSLAVNAYLFGELSYWSGVKLLGPARVLIAERGRVETRRYWRPDFTEQRTPDPSELQAAVQECVTGHIAHFEHPVLALSGGVDSRVILAAARRAGLKLDTVTWTYDLSERAEADFAVARRVAHAAGVPNAQHRLSDRNLADQASDIVYACDGLNGFLGAFADRQALAEELATRHDAIVFGDQCYRGEREIRTHSDALERVGIRTGPRVSLARFLMHADAAAECLADYQCHIDALLADIGECGTPHDLHDRLYWQVRVPRLLTGPKALWRMHIESLSPLLDVPMLELARRLPVEQRADKTFLRDGLRHMAPDLADLGFSTVHSRTKWRQIFKETGPVQRYIVETLLDPLPEFDRWFDRASIEVWLKGCMIEARQHRAENVASGSPLTRLTRRVRSAWANRAFNPRVVLNLLTLKLWFHHFGRERP